MHMTKEMLRRRGVHPPHPRPRRRPAAWTHGDRAELAPCSTRLRRARHLRALDIADANRHELSAHAPIARLDAIATVETFIVSIPRDVPYLGPLRDGETINDKGYLVRKGNRSIYPATDMSRARRR